MPESIRFLMTHGRMKETNTILQKSAKMNKVKLPDDVISRLDNGATTSGKTYTLLDIFKSWKFAIIALNVWFNGYVIILIIELSMLMTRRG